MNAPIVVVGAGVAGLTTALAAAPAPVLLVSRERGDAATALAQGGIAAALGNRDAPAEHARDTLSAGSHHNDAAFVHWLCTQAGGAIDWLRAQGVAFDRDGEGNLQLGREGGHGAARIVHAGGDATGAELMRALCERVARAAHVQWIAGMDVEALRLRDGAACGLRACAAGGQRHEFDASAVVLATGGIGALFACTSNPPGAQGAGLALGMAAGALTRDLEFVQFHPTALDIPGRHCLPLVTEALRGAGACLRDDAGRPLMRGVHPLQDLAPRDVVARRIWRERQHGTRVWLDARAVQGEWTRRFPTVFAAALAVGIDPRNEPLPVAPAAHFHMGGLAVDRDGRTSVPGLYAVGEVACNGAHGANRLASNSLLEGVVCGRHLGAVLAAHSAVPARGPVRWAERGAVLPESLCVELRELLWDSAGPEREAATLRGALHACMAWREAGWQARVGHAVLEAALRRGGSLGAHFRRDAHAATLSGRRMATPA
ncbi:MAG TPA: FAD-binding protein [Rudaea sp.]|nr:FAD-binding protein [Rudaea sp.]